MSPNHPIPTNERFFQSEDALNSSGCYEVVRSEVVELKCHFAPDAVIMLIYCRFLDSARAWDATVSHTKPRKQWRILRCPAVLGIGNRVVDTDWTKVQRLLISSLRAKRLFDDILKTPYRMVTSKWMGVKVQRAVI